MKQKDIRKNILLCLKDIRIDSYEVMRGKPEFTEITGMSFLRQSGYVKITIEGYIKTK